MERTGESLPFCWQGPCLLCGCQTTQTSPIDAASTHDGLVPENDLALYAMNKPDREKIKKEALDASRSKAG